MFWDNFSAMINGCMAVLNIPINLGGFNLTLWMILLGSIVICLVARLVWGVLD